VEGSSRPHARCGRREGELGAAYTEAGCPVPIGNRLAAEPMGLIQFKTEWTAHGLVVAAFMCSNMGLSAWLARSQLAWWTRRTIRSILAYSIFSGRSPEVW